jgi:hypothetical protein
VPRPARCCHGAPLAAVAGALLGLLAACSAPAARGYYAPAGVELGATLASHREESSEAVLDVRCQGAYLNRVNGAEALTVHVQLDATRPRPGELRLFRDRIVADVRLSPDAPRVTLPLSEAWSRRQRIEGDLVVPAWSLRPFDLFFDASELAQAAPPESVVVRWEGEAAGAPVAGQCLFERIPEGDPRLPGDEPTGDLAFGMRAGYYLPGQVKLGHRALLPSDEERLHYIFHDPGKWQW